MRTLLENIIKDYEENNSIVEKKNNIRKLANEFTKEETIRVNQLKAKGQKIEYSPNMRMLEMALYLDQNFKSNFIPQEAVFAISYISSHFQV